MRTYKSPEPAAAVVAQVSQSSQQSSTHLSIFPFLKLATLSFAIPPPISASVRSRQAGTETEREASAMEALGPGKKFEKIENELWAGSASRVWGACAQMRRFTGGRGCSEASTRWRENKPRPSPCVCVNVWLSLFTPSSSHVFCPNEGGWCFYRCFSNVCAVLFIWSTHSPSCRVWHCVSGDLTRTFLPPSFRVVVCLRWCLFMMFLSSHITTTSFLHRGHTIQSKFDKISRMYCLFSAKPSKYVPSPSGTVRLYGLPSSKMTAMGGKQNKCQWNTRYWREMSRRACFVARYLLFSWDCEITAGMNGAFIDQICGPAPYYPSPIW